MKIVSIGGVPATGKTTLVRKVMQLAGNGVHWELMKYRKMYYQYHVSGLIVLGIYDEKLFSGTDRLHMAVIDDAEAFLEEHQKMNFSLLLEGDRLFNQRFLKKIQEMKIENRILILNALSNNIYLRHLEREKIGMQQDNKWILGRATKTANICGIFGKIAEVHDHNTPEDTEALALDILKYFNLGVH